MAGKHGRAALIENIAQRVAALTSGSPVPLPSLSSTLADFQSCLICIARRLPRPTAVTSTESFVTKQDTTGTLRREARACCMLGSVLAGEPPLQSECAWAHSISSAGLWYVGVWLDVACLQDSSQPGRQCHRVLNLSRLY